MQAVGEKELPEREKIDLVVEIIEKFRKKRVSFRQASEILCMAQQEMQKLPLSDGYTVTELLS